MKMKQILSVALLAFLVIMAGCKSNRIQGTAKNTIPSGNWLLIKMGDTTVNESDYERGLPSIIFKDSSSFSGSTGCNQYMATYKHSPESVDITMGPLTKMFCPGDAEKNFLNAIDKTNHVDVKDKILTFYENDKSLMTFQKIE